MIATPPPKPPLQVPSGSAESTGPSLLVIAGGVLVTSGLLTIALALYGERSVQPEALLQKLFTFVSQFPTLLLGFSLLFLGRERPADRTGWPWRLLRLGSLLLLLLYLATIPTAGVLLQGLKDRLDTRLQNVLQAGSTRGAQIEADLAKLDSTPALLAALRTYPEISNIDLPATATPAQVRSAVGNAIRQGIDAQKIQGRQQIAGIVKVQDTLVRTIVANAALASIGFLLLSARLLPWVDTVTRLLMGTVTTVVTQGRSLMRTSQRDLQRALTRPSAPSNPTPRPLRRGPGVAERLTKQLKALESGFGTLIGGRRSRGGRRR